MVTKRKIHNVGVFTLEGNVFEFTNNLKCTNGLCLLYALSSPFTVCASTRALAIDFQANSYGFMKPYLYEAILPAPKGNARELICTFIMFYLTRQKRNIEHVTKHAGSLHAPNLCL